MRFGRSKPRPGRGSEGAPTAACRDRCLGVRTLATIAEAEIASLSYSKCRTRPQSWQPTCPYETKL